MHKTRWKAITAARLQKWNIPAKERFGDPSGYASNPLYWEDAIRFEVQHYGTTLRSRQYLMRRWQDRIMNIPDEFKGNMIILLECLSDSLARKAQWADFVSQREGSLENLSMRNTQ